MKKLFALAAFAEKVFSDQSTSSVAEESHIASDIAPSSARGQSLSPVVKAAITCLAKALQSTICDISSDEISGFAKLVTILESTVAHYTEEDVCQSNGFGCLQILLNNLENSRLTEFCNQTSLVDILIQTLRLLRMHEINLAKSSLIPVSVESSSFDNHGVTFLASQRLCIVLRVLCADPQTIEKIRQQLLGLLSFPITAMPKNGIHFLEHSSIVISQMFVMGFNAHQIWFLHDQQVVEEILSSLSDLTGLSTKVDEMAFIPEPDRMAVPAFPSAIEDEETAEDKRLRASLVKGRAAEAEGLWLSALSCVVDLIACTVGVTPVLMDDFEKADGYKLVSLILQKSAPDKLMKIMTVSSRLLFDPKKGVDEAIAFPSSGSIFADLLLRSLDIEKGVSIDDSVQSMITTATTLSRRQYSSLPQYEHIVQNLAYLLLTLYSHNPINCSILEGAYQLIPTLLVAVPAFKLPDTVPAILTTLNYICQCVESASNFPIVAFCAAAAVVMSNAIMEVRAIDAVSIRSASLGDLGENNSSSSDSISCSSILSPTQHSLDSIYASIDAMLRGNPDKYAISLVRCGLMEHFIYTHLKNLKSSYLRGDGANADLVSIYRKLVNLTLSLMKKSEYVADEMKRIGVLTAIKEVLECAQISSDMASALLLVFEEISKERDDHLEESLQSIIDIGNEIVDSRRERTLLTQNRRLEIVACTMKSLGTILKSIDNAHALWRGLKGFDAVVVIVRSMDAAFSAVKASPLASSSVSLPMPYEVPDQPTPVRVVHRSDTDAESDSLAADSFNLSVEYANQCLTCLHSILEFLELDVSSTTLTLYRYDIDKQAHKSHERSFALSLFTIDYSAFASALRDTLIFESIFKEEGVRLLLRLINGGSNGIVNPQALDTVVSLLQSFSDDLIIFTVTLLKDHIQKTPNGPQMLAESGFVSTLIEKFSPLIVSCFNTVLARCIYDLVADLISDYLTIRDFTTLLRCFLKQDAAALNLSPSESSLALLPPWTAFDVSLAEKDWIGSGMLETILKYANSRLDGVPHVSLGSSDFGAKSAYIECITAVGGSGVTSPNQAAPGITHGGFSFPVAEFTYSSWARVKDLEPTLDRTSFLHSETKDTHPADTSSPQASASPTMTVMCLIALSFSGSVGCFFEVHVDFDLNFIRVVLKKGNEATTLRFKPPFVMNKNRWNHFAVTFKKVKRFTASPKTTVEVYVNGLQSSAVNSGACEIEISPPSSIASLKMTIGKFVLGQQLVLTETSAVGDEEFLMSKRGDVTFDQGPILLYDEVLVQSQISSIFFKGPAYTGFLPSESSVLGDPVMASCFIIRKCNHTSSSLSVDEYVDLLGFKGLHEIVDASPGSVQGLHQYEISSISSSPVLCFNAASYKISLLENSVFGASGGDVDQSKLSAYAYQRGTRSSFSLLNVAPSSSSAGTYSGPYICSGEPEMNVINGHTLRVSESFASSVSSLGGPAILFPILQAASAASQIARFFRILKTCIFEDSSNLKYMQVTGYRVCSFLLSLKPKHVCNVEVMHTIFDLIVDRAVYLPDQTNKKFVRDEKLIETFLCVDTRAFYYLLMNTSIWDLSNQELVLEMLQLFRRLVEDSRYGLLNTKRLTALGTARWVLLLCTQILHMAQKERKRHSKHVAASPPMPPSPRWSTQRLTYATAVDVSQAVKVSLSGSDTVSGDSFILLVLRIVHSFVKVDMKKRDLDLIAHLILFTLHLHFDIHGVSEDVATAITSASEVESEAPSSSNRSDYSSSPTNVPSKTSKANVVLSELSTLRVYLLSYLSLLYEKLAYENEPRPTVVSSEGTSPLTIYKAVVSPLWLLTFRDKIADVASLNSFLRLLSTLFHCPQRDPSLIKLFCANSSLKFINIQLVSQWPDTPLVIPLLSLLFRIPIQTLPDRLTSPIGLSFLDSLDLSAIDETDSASVSSEMSLQLFDLLLDAVVHMVRVKDREDSGKRIQSLFCDSVFMVVSRALDTTVGFRKLLLDKSTLKSVVNALLLCSDLADESLSNMLPLLIDRGISGLKAVDSQQFQQPLSGSSVEGLLSQMSSPDTGGLHNLASEQMPQSFLRKNVDSFQSASSQDGSFGADQGRTRALSSSSVCSLSGRLGLIFHHDEGQLLRKLVFSAILYSVTDLVSPTVLLTLFQTFPENANERHVLAYQHMLVDCLCESVDVILSRGSVGIASLQSISNALSSLLSMSVVEQIDCRIELELFNLSVLLLNRCNDFLVSSDSATSEKVSAVEKDIGSVARYFAVHCVHLATRLPVAGAIEGADISPGIDESLRYELLKSVRVNMNICLLPSISDGSLEYIQIHALPRKRGIIHAMSESFIDATTAGVQPLTHMGGVRRPAVADFPLSTHDIKLRVSNIFCIHLLYSCFSIILENRASSLNREVTADTSLEAMRIIAWLSMRQKPALEALISSSLQSLPSPAPITKVKISSGDSTSVPSTESPIRTLTEVSPATDDVSDLHSTPVLLLEGLDKLEPDRSSFESISSYELFLEGESGVCSAEADRFYAFEEWLRVHENNHEKSLVYIKTHLAAVGPFDSYNQPTDKSRNRSLLLFRSKEDPSLDVSSHVEATIMRADEAQKSVDVVEEYISRWELHGFFCLASGANSWRRLWHIHRSSTLWGYGGGLGNVGYLPFGNSSSLSLSNVGTLDVTTYWKLDAAVEGPERRRKRLVQDFGGHIQALFESEHKSVLERSPSPTPRKRRSHALYGKRENNISSMSSLSRMSGSSVDSLFDSPKSKSPARQHSSELLEKELSSIPSPIMSQGITFDAALGLPDASVASPEPISVDSIIVTAATQDWHQATEVEIIDKVLDLDEFDQDDDGDDGLDESFDLTNSMENFLQNITSKGFKYRRRSDSTVQAAVDDDDDGDVAAESVTAETETDFASADAEQRNGDVNQSDLVSPADRSLDEFEFDGEMVENVSTVASALFRPKSRQGSTKMDAIMELVTDIDASAPEAEKQHPDGSMRSLLTANDLESLSAKKALEVLDIIKAVLGASEWQNGKVFNVKRIFGLEAQPALLLITKTTVHILGGFVFRYVEDDQSASYVSKHAREKIVERALTVDVAGGGGFFSSRKSCISDDLVMSNEDWLRGMWADLLGSGDQQHVKLSLHELYLIFRRRYQLKATALELQDTNGVSLLFACETYVECEEIMKILFEADLASSVFKRTMGMKNLLLLRGPSFVYRRYVTQFVSQMTRMWLHGELSNFEYLMHLNSAAGRSYNDLTQYPVFPWVLSDYSSKTLDLNDPHVYRDLSKPMGAQSSRRARHYLERFRSMEEMKRSGLAEGSPPSFHYGTHYSCAGYALNYLIRLQPYANMAVALQGGSVDIADRLFSSIEDCWSSASNENIQDVRELIPEFFYLPEFLQNGNNFVFGNKQNGDKVHDVVLPPWANNDPKEFVRINREALESPYTSENLHHWIDLIFGYKQKGEAAEKAMNVFIHLTYEDEVDVDEIEDPVMRSATIDQINNFGQTPSRLFHKPHPKRNVPDILKKTVDGGVVVDSQALVWHDRLSAPLTVITGVSGSLAASLPSTSLLAVCNAGIRTLIPLYKVAYSQVLTIPASSSSGEGANTSASVASAGSTVPSSSFTSAAFGIAVGDVRLLSKDRAIAAPLGCAILPPTAKKLVRVGLPAGAVCFSSLSSLPQLALFTASSSRLFDAPDISGRDASIHEAVHQGFVTCVSVSKRGDLMVTGSEDTSIRLWNIQKLASFKKIEHLMTFVGHTASVICVELCTEFQTVVSGSADGTARVWDMLTGKMVRVLGSHDSAVLSVSISSGSGNMASLTANQLNIWGINGDLIAGVTYTSRKLPDAPGNTPTLGTQPSTLTPLPPMAAAFVPGLGAQRRFSTGRVVVVPNTPDWLDGVVAVTGHESGNIHLWQLKKDEHSGVSSSAKAKDKGDKEEAGTGATSPISAATALVDGDNKTNSKAMAAIVTVKSIVPVTLVKVHRAPITALRIGVPPSTSKAKDPVDRCFDDANSVQLTAGDKDGFVSIWSTHRLDQWSAAELMTVLNSGS